MPKRRQVPKKNVKNAFFNIPSALPSPTVVGVDRELVWGWEGLLS